MMFFSCFAFGQPASVYQGIVTDDNQIPISGATISIRENPQKKSVTAKDGRFSIEAVLGQTLVISNVGFDTKSLLLGSQYNLTIQLLSDEKNIDEVVVVGYGSLKRKNLTSSITTVGGDVLEDKPVVSFDQAIAGKVPGVNISQSNGAPGGGVSINIRGTGSITGGTSPLYVVDGLPLSSNSSDRFNQGGNNFNYTVNPLNNINPADILDIQILKDAAATAIYGSRGANGVVIITTKRGKGEVPSISFNSYIGTSKLAKKVDVMDAYELANYMVNARNIGWVSKDPLRNKITDPLSIRTIDDRYPLYMLPYVNNQPGLTNTDWQDEFYRDAFSQNYDFSVGGNTERTNYYTSLGYLNQEGIIPNSGIERYSGRVNLESKLGKNVKFGVNLNPTYINNNLARSEKNWGDEGLVIGVLMSHPNLPAYNEDGSYAVDKHYEVLWSGESNIVQFQNPIALANVVENRLNQYNLIFNTDLEISLLKNLKFKTMVGGNFGYNHRKYYRPKSLSYRTEKAPTSYFNFGEVFNSTISNILWDNSLEFSDTYGKHDLNVVLGNSVQREINKNSTAEGRNFATDNVTTINTSQDRYSNELVREWKMLSYFTRVSYAYDSRYLFMATLRADGSSKFGRKSKWGVFPSVSGAWRVSEEDFFSKNIINDLKIRASYGVSGNNDIPYYGSMSLLSTNGKYTIGDNVMAGLFPSSSPNEELSWETTGTFDIGFDMQMWNALTVNFDYYNSKTTDLLLNVPVPSSSGYTESLQNIGSLSNKGVELGLGYKHDFSEKSRFNINLNFSKNINSVLQLGPGQEQIISSGGLTDSHITRIGHSIGSFFGYKVVGKFETEQQVAELAKFGNQKVGDFIYQDTNGDGVVNAADRVILGSNLPKYEFGINLGYNFNDFDFNVSLYSKQKFQVINTMHRYLAEAWGNNLSVYLENDAPRPVWAVGSATHTRASSWQLEDASFVRVRDITLGYRLPRNLVSKMKLNNLRVYVAMLNPFTWTNYSGYNPEISSNFNSALTPGEEFGNYPVSKSFNFGINLTF